MLSHRVAVVILILALVIVIVNVTTVVVVDSVAGTRMFTMRRASERRCAEEDLSE